jgi:hypothetical protein
MFSLTFVDFEPGTDSMVKCASGNDTDTTISGRVGIEKFFSPFKIRSRPRSKKSSLENAPTLPKATRDVAARNVESISTRKRRPSLGRRPGSTGASTSARSKAAIRCS